MKCDANYPIKIIGNSYHLPPILIAAFPVVSQRSGASSTPLIARNNLGIVKKVEIPAAAENDR